MRNVTPAANERPTRRLGDLLVRHNEIIHPGDRKTGEAVFVGLEHIEPNSGRRIGSLTIDLGKLTGRKPTFRRGQVVYGYLRPYLNKVWIADFDGCSSVDQFAFDVRRELADTKFIAAFMRSETFLQRSEVVTTTGQLPRISIDEIEAVPIELPPIVDQRRIVSELDESLAAVDVARSAAEDRLAAAEALRAAFLAEVFEGPHASGWRTVPLADVCRPVEGQVDPRNPEYRGLPHINGETIESGSGRLLDIRSAEEDGLISGKYLFERGMVLYSKLRPYLRKVAIAPTRGLCSADMYPLIFDEERVDCVFAMFTLLAKPFTTYAIAESRRARMPKLNREQLFAWQMPLPSLEDQRRLAAELSDRLQATESLAAACRGELAAIEALPPALLREAFNGVR